MILKVALAATLLFGTGVITGLGVSRFNRQEPAIPSERCNIGSWISAASTIAYSITSNESSIHPSEAATKARRARTSASVHHVKRPTLGFCVAMASTVTFLICANRLDRHPGALEPGADSRGEVV